MVNIDKTSYSVNEVAKYLNCSTSTIQVYKTKDSNNPQKPLHQFWSSIKSPIDGQSLTSVKGYYIPDGNGSEECVYAEYVDKNGRSYSYVKHPRESVISQMRYDGVFDTVGDSSTQSTSSTSNYKSNGGKINMEDLTQLNYASVKAFNEAIETFIATIKHECDRMDTGISSCQGHMKDEQSSIILRKANEAVSNIRDCVDPAVKINEKLLELLSTLESYGLTD